MIAVEKIQLQGFGELAADGGLAGAHGADEKNALYRIHDILSAMPENKNGAPAGERAPRQLIETRD